MFKRLSHHIYKHLPFCVKKYISKLKLYIKAPYLLLYANTPYKTASSPVLLLSLPRSGSSWIGSILGMGDLTRYLREPATTRYIQHKKNRISVFNQNSCDDWKHYKAYINDALNGVPNFSYSVIAFNQQWKTPKESKSLVIKEVNPLIIDHYLGKNLTLIYLIRHPFSISKSYKALGWQPKEIFTRKFDSKTLQKLLKYSPNLLSTPFTEQMAYFQGWTEALVKNRIQTHVACKAKSEQQSSISCVKYEEICQQPEVQFKQLFEDAKLTLTDNIAVKIKQSLAADKTIAAGDFSLTRNKHQQSKVIIHQNEQEEYQSHTSTYLQGFADYCQSENIDDDSIKPSYPINSPFVVYK